jgi:hypothetical protein
LSGASADRVREEMALTMEPLLQDDDLKILLEVYSRMSGYNDSLRQRYREVVFGEGA